MRYQSPYQSVPRLVLGDDVRGHRALLVGGGASAAGAARRLLTAGARLTVVAPDLSPEFYDWAYEGAAVLERRRFRSSDAARHDLVVAATGRETVDRLVVDAARLAGVPVEALEPQAEAATHEAPAPRLVTPAPPPGHPAGVV